MLRNNKLTIAVDIGGSKLMLGMVSREGEVIHKVKVPISCGITAEQVIDIILSNVYAMKAQFQGGVFDGVGVAIPGLADADTGVWIYSCFSGIRDFNISGILSEELKLPVFIGNDVNVCAMGEKIFGACRDDEDFVWITVSNGVGGGLVLNGRIYNGAFKNAGEIGHINVVENGELCPCGNQGCLEAYASGVAIARRYQKETAMDSEDARFAVSAKEIADMARAGDKLASKIYHETGHFLGKAIASVANVVNPSKVILGGGVSMDMDLFIDSLKSTVKREAFMEANRNLKIERTALLYDAALIGAAAMAQERGNSI